MNIAHDQPYLRQLTHRRPDLDPIPLWQAYRLARPTPDLLACVPVAEYTRDVHDRSYRAIRHISVKQARYLAGGADIDDKDGS